MIVDDAPAYPTNSLIDPATGQPYIAVPVDSALHWQLARWYASRPGLALADILPPFWVAGGKVTVSGGGYAVTAAEGWAIEEVRRQERFMRRIFTLAAGPSQLVVPQPPSGLSATLIAMQLGQATSPQPQIVYGTAPTPGVGQVVVHPLLMPVGLESHPDVPPLGGVSYIGAPLQSAFDVPLALIFRGSAASGGANQIVDMRTKPFAWTITNLFTSSANKVTLDLNGNNISNQDAGYGAVPNLRLFVYAAAGSLIELAAQFSMRTVGTHHGTVVSHAGKGTSLDATFIVNLEPIEGGDADRGGFEVLSSTTHASRVESGKNADFLQFRARLTSKATAIHHIQLGVKNLCFVYAGQMAARVGALPTLPPPG